MKRYWFPRAHSNVVTFQKAMEKGKKLPGSFTPPPAVLTACSNARAAGVSGQSAHREALWAQLFPSSDSHGNLWSCDVPSAIVWTVHPGQHSWVLG